jgi:hypothetical protein
MDDGNFSASQASACTFKVTKHSWLRSHNPANASSHEPHMLSLKPHYFRINLNVSSQLCLAPSTGAPLSRSCILWITVINLDKPPKYYLSALSVLLIIKRKCHRRFRKKLFANISQRNTRASNYGLTHLRGGGGCTWSNGWVGESKILLNMLPCRWLPV